MRLIARTVYRAFPELDPFSDDECRIFVRNATASPWRRAMRFLVNAAVLAGILMAEVRISGAVAREVPSIAHIAWTIVAMLCTLGLGALIVRDLLLRLAVRRILGRGAACPQCGYPLAGLPVGAEFRVTCPECARVTDVSVHASHCAAGSDGLLRFLPGPGAQVAADPWLTRRRVRTAATWSAAITAGMVLVLSIPAVWWELRLRGMAAAAGAAAESLPPASELLAATEPAGANVPGANAIDALTEFDAKCASLKGSDLLRELDSSQQFWWFRSSRLPEQGSSLPPLEVRTRIAAQFLPGAREAGLVEVLERLGDAPAIRIADYPVSGNMLVPRVMARMDALQEGQRRASNLAALWMLDACARMQPAEAARAFRALATLSSVRGMLRPFPYAGHVVGAAQFLEHLAQVCRLPGGDEALRIARQAVAHNLACRFTPESIVALETRYFQEELIRAFGDPAVLRWRVFPWVRTRAYHNGIGLRWGPGSPVVDDPSAFAFDFEREWAASLDALPADLLIEARSARWDAPAPSASLSGTLPPVAGAYVAWTRRWVPGLESMRLADFAVACVLAVEEFRRANDRLPATLAELVPAHLPALPPRSLGIIYRTVEGAGCPLGYQLYSMAFDGSDDGCSPERDFPIVGAPVAASDGDVASDPASDSEGASTPPGSVTRPN